MGEFAVGDDGEITTVGKKLHDLGALASELCPTGGGFGILFQAAVVGTFESEIDLSEATFGGAADWIGLVGNSDSIGAIDESLSPDGEEDFVQRRRHAIRRHIAMIAGKGEQRRREKAEEKKGAQEMCPC